ncbi:sigma-70 family RNA polymerase sigma factor [Aureimonas sp. ME7]|uniref:RNA polymerase sigma factor n=1 Tax=Aureimonas sp. ME7 TaxID=2744252 RepID=UPI0015F716A9|nr:sigma-70 family RNA polymerase sigma factor [Aureimonas sp. ME7]
MTDSAIDWGQLYRSEEGRLRGLVQRLVGNRATAEDLVHQAFLHLLRQADPACRSAPAYLTTTVRNLALNHLRDARRRGETSLTDLDLDALTDGKPSPEASAIYRCELRRLLGAVAELPERRRQAFLLSRMEELTYDEIALRMNVSRNTVISHVVAALADLSRRLER